MSEREPKQRNFNISLNGEIITCTPENTFGYLHEDERYDHLFHMTGIDAATGAIEGHYIWRQENEDQRFVQLIYFMVNNGYDVTNQDLQPCDLEAYNERFPELPRKELTERQENHVRYLGHLLNKNLLEPSDFRSESESIL